MPTIDTQPRFTVIIPTKDRARYLYHTLRTCAMQDYENLEVIVSDDGSVDDTRAVVEEAARQDSRIRYVSPGAGVGMLDNFEFALDQVKPGYVLALGGDDGLMPYGVRRMWDLLRTTGQQLLAWPAPAFFYPSVRSEKSQLVIRARNGRPLSGTRILSSREFLARQAKHLFYVDDIESPMFYVKGVVSTDLVKRVRARTKGGRFYACSTPDGYSGIVLAGEVGTYGFSGEPLSLHGVSPTSAGVSYLADADRSRAQSEAFFKLAARVPMHRDLGAQPYSPLISLMSADYLLTARDLPGWPGTVPPIDFRRLLVKGLAELQDGLFAANRVARELRILHGVAEHHGLGEYFRQRVRTSRRNTRQPLVGNAISPSRLYIDAAKLGVENVVDAAYFAYFAHASISHATIPALWRAVVNSIRYRLLSVARDGAFPPEQEWMPPAPAERVR